MNDGGPAFPTHPNSPTSPAGWHGLSLRDWFAGMAMQGILAAQEIEDDGTGMVMILHNDAAEDAYYYADAMIAERSKRDSDAN